MKTSRLILILLFISFNKLIFSQSDAGPDQEICSDETYLSAIDPVPYTGTWSVVSGSGTFSNPNGFNTLATNISEGDNIYRWEVTIGLDVFTDDVTISNNKPTTANAGKDTIICNSVLPALYANSNYNIDETTFWRVLSGSANIIDPTAFNSSVENLDLSGSGSINTFEWVIQKGSCESTDQVRVINGLPGYADAGTDQIVCDNIVNLNAPDLGAGAQSTWWEEIPNTGDFYDPLTGFPIADYNISVLPDPVDMPFNIHVEGIQNGMTQFIWHKKNEYQYSDGSWFKCELTDTVEITGLGLTEDVQAGPEDATCDNYFVLNATDPSTSFAAGPPFDVVSGNWTCISGAGDFDDQSYFGTTVRNIAASDNIYRWTVRNHSVNCEISDDVYIHSARPSNAYAGDDAVTCDNFEVLSSNVPFRYTSAFWSVVAGSATILDNSCTGFACNALATNLSPNQNIFVWHVINEYSGGWGGYGGVLPPLECELTDTMIVYYRGVEANAGVDIYECGDVTNLLATKPDNLTVNSGYWSNPGVTFTSSGTNTSTLFNDEVSGLSRGVNTLTWTVQNNWCSDNDQVVVYGLLPPVPGANIDQTICSSTVLLAANDVNDYWAVTNPVPPFDVRQEAIATGHWSSPNPLINFSSSSTFNTLAFGLPAQTTSTFVWHSVNQFTDHVTGLAVPDCELTDTMFVFNNSVVADAGFDQTVCETGGVSASTTLQADFTQNGTWTQIGGPAGPTILSPTAYNTQVINMTQTNDYVFQWHVSATRNGFTCNAYDDMTVHVDIPTVAAITTGATLEVCDKIAIIQGNAPSQLGETGIWTTTSGSLATIDDPSNNIATLTYQDYQNEVAVWRWTLDINGCSTFDEITITNNSVFSDADRFYNPNIELNTCGPDTLLNAEDPNNFNSAGPDAVGFWTTVTGGSATYDDPSLYNTTVRNLSNIGVNTLLWTISKGGCTELSRLDILSYEEISHATASDQENCTGVFILDGNIPGAGETGFWNIVAGSGTIDEPAMYNSEFRGDVIGATVTLSWTISNSHCSDKVYVALTDNNFVISAGPDAIVNTSDYSMQGDDPFLGTGAWSVVSGSGIFNDLSLFNSLVSSLSEGENVFKWTVTKNNCTNEDDVSITYDPVSIDILNDLKISIYPNPSNGIINIATDHDISERNIMIISSTGKEVDYKIKSRTNKLIETDLTHLAKGIYFVKIRIEDRVQLYKIILK